MSSDTLQLPGWLPPAGVYPLRPDRCIGELAFRVLGVRLRGRVEPQSGALTVTMDSGGSRLTMEGASLPVLSGGPPGLAWTMRRMWPRAGRIGGLRLDVTELDRDRGGRLRLTADLYPGPARVPMDLTGRVVCHDGSAWTFVASGRVRLHATCWKYASRPRRLLLSRWIQVLVAAEFAL